MTMINKRNMKAAVILILIIILILSPLTSLGNDPVQTGGSGEQIGNYVKVDDTGNIINDNAGDPDVTTTSNDGTWVKQSKTIEGTDTEDLFKINLSVTTNEVRTTSTSIETKPVDVVIIMDVSGSMTNSITSGSATMTRWVAARANMITFINNFLGDGSTGNRVAIGTFSGTKNVDKNGNDQNQNNDHNINICNWTGSAETAVSTIAGKSVADMRASGQGSGTNMQAGFIAADEIMDKASASTNDKVVIYVGDGKATYHYDNIGRTIGNGSDNTAAHNNNALAAMKNLKNKYSDLKLYTMGIGTESDFNAVLKQNVGQNDFANQFFYVNSAIAIQQAFTSITNTITHSVDVWNVTDPMSQYVNFKGFADENGDLTSSTTHYSNTASINTDDNIIGWSLGADNVEKNDDGTFTYSLSYYVELNTFDDTYYPTNKITTLDFAFKTDGEGDAIQQEFKIPTVKGATKTTEIQIFKNVNGQSGSSEEFEFVVETGDIQSLYNGKYTKNGGNSEYDMKDGEFTLSDGEFITIKGLPIGTPVKVTEKATNEFYTVKDGIWTLSSVVSAGTNDNIVFTNDYNSSIGAIKASNPQSGSNVKVGEKITYSITVKNNDKNGTATGIVVRDEIPQYTTFDSAENDGILITDDGDNYVRWFIKEIAPGGSETVYFTVEVTEEFDKSVENTAQYKITNLTDEDEAFENTDPFDDTNTINHLPYKPSFIISKSNGTSDYASVNPGEEIEYTITITNTGKVPLEKVWVRDYVPTYTSYKSGGTFNSKGNYVDWIIENIPVEGSSKVSFKVTVNKDASDVTIKNVALAELIENDKPERDPNIKSNPVYNQVPYVKPEIVLPEGYDSNGDEQVMGEKSTPDGQQVLGEEAKTSDTMNSISFLMTILIFATGIVLIVLKRMRYKENDMISR